MLPGIYCLRKAGVIMAYKRLISYFDLIENELKRVLGTKVTLNAATKSRGKIVIEYFSAEELDRILEILGIES